MALIALGVTGGIGAYKAVEVCRGLQKRGHDVVAVMTKAATRFVGPITFEAITRRPVITSQWKPGANADIEHIAIADDIALLLVAPCTANVIGKFANGIADSYEFSLSIGGKIAPRWHWAGEIFFGRQVGDPEQIFPHPWISTSSRPSISVRWTWTLSDEEVGRFFPT